MTKAIVTIAAGVLLCAGMAHAVATPEEKCQSERAKAAGTYASCQQKAQAQYQTTDGSKLQGAASRCRLKYTGTWAKLRKKTALAGTSCAAARFVDNGDGTVTDNLTGLQWETKTNLDQTANSADPHDADNVYQWCVNGADVSACNNPNAADGDAFTDFLRSLNSGACFAGQCDWRLPTRDELQTIRDDFTGLICEHEPSCIDAFFGPTAANAYWSATSDAISPSFAWSVNFASAAGGNAVGNVFFKGSDQSVRGVRGGL